METLHLMTTSISSSPARLLHLDRHVLGPRPELVPRRGVLKVETYQSLRDRWDDFSNALVAMENLFPFSSDAGVTSVSAGNSLLGVGTSLYFAIPANDQLLEQWDTVADRLYKIRHCQDIDGVERRLALFTPPIEPGGPDSGHRPGTEPRQHPRRPRQRAAALSLRVLAAEGERILRRRQEPERCAPGRAREADAEELVAAAGVAGEPDSRPHDRNQGAAAPRIRNTKYRRNCRYSGLFTAQSLVINYCFATPADHDSI